MLDDHEGGAGGVEDPADGIPNLGHALRVEVGRRLIEQEQPGPHGEHTRQGEALLLAAREVRGGAVERHRKTDLIETVAHALPDLVAGDTEVLAAEGDVVAHPGEDDLGVRILQHEPGPPGSRGRAVDEQRSFRVTLVGREDAGEGAKERGFARAGLPEQQHPLSGCDAQVEAAQRPGQPRGRSPPPAGGGDARWLGQTRVAISRPAAKRLRAPVRASPRTASHDSSPAMSAPPTTPEIV